MFFWVCNFNQLEHVYSHSQFLLVLSTSSCKLSCTFICQSHQLKLFLLPRKWPSKPVKMDSSDKASFVCFTQCLFKTDRVFLREHRRARKEAKNIDLENFQTKSYFLYYLSKILSSCTSSHYHYYQFFISSLKLQCRLSFFFFF